VDFKKEKKRKGIENLKEKFLDKYRNIKNGKIM